ncbi:tRNA wybutosine-synthesizing protein 3 homolog [Gallus gallus]|uniref:tRNA wybutosine-synthesizing protein 3 homolog n=1 Tax=Gallus gallus TaxID=9031 RepID=A0A1D5PIG9_CHICK|nr:tRNA wybutosine-synthesizing protein 3 homolog [Gallus gallus]|eukprot:NP_001264564.1 tRNA wybutosine-synthesizing protein 3 homolog [Gallus gallus]
MAAFGRWKAQRLARADCSRRGALDERAAGVVRLLNGRAPFCTTSSCSGRLVLAEGGAAESAGVPAAIPKKRCRWLLVAHEPCGRADVMAALEKATGDVVFKFEPFVLHVLCQELQDAQLLHSVAIESGFKNSGITVGRGGKIMMAVRSAHCLEVPLSHMGKLMVSEEYIEFLVHVANQKMEENARRIDRFYKHLEAALEAAGGVSNSPSTDTQEVHAVYVRRRKRRTVQTQDVLPSPEGHNEELEPGDDPEGSLDIFAGITL